MKKWRYLMFRAKYFIFRAGYYWGGFLQKLLYGKKDG